jgi:fucose 4-O-acetylase-like acetyltransferase
MTATLTRLPPAPSAGAKTRDPWFDNAKMLLVVLVVVGHSWTLVAHSTGTRWAYDFLYLWHVPAFVMVTGYLSRSFTFSRRHLARLGTTVVLPYLVFELLLTTFRSVVGGEAHGPLFLNPHWPLWYLSVLFLWRLATPVLRRLPHALPVAVALSLAGGAFAGDPLDWARATGLLPFFVTGLLATPAQVAALRGRAVRTVAAVTLLLAAVGAGLVEPRLGTEWLYWRSSYAELHASLLTGLALRSLLLAVSGLLALAFLALVPGRDGWFTRLGPATLVVYLWHGFVVKSVSYTGFPAWSQDRPMTALLLATLGAVPLALLLAWSPLSRPLGAVVDPVGAWQRHRARSGDPGKVGGGSPDRRHGAAGQVVELTRRHR